MRAVLGVRVAEARETHPSEAKSSDSFEALFFFFGGKKRGGLSEGRQGRQGRR